MLKRSCSVKSERHQIFPINHLEFGLMWTEAVIRWKFLSVSHLLLCRIVESFVFGGPGVWSAACLMILLRLTSKDTSYKIKSQLFCVCLAGRASSTEPAWTSPEERSCWFGTTTPTRPSSASRCSASLRMKTVRRHFQLYLCLLVEDSGIDSSGLSL